MKICFLAPANNYHTKKWCHYFVTHGYDVSVLSLTAGKIDRVSVYWLNAKTDVGSSDFRKLRYLLQFHHIRQLMDEIQPDIINAHYASSYGTLAALAGLKNYIVSVWGSDVYEFPQKSFFHKKLLEYSLNSAACVFSTSKAMAVETRKYTQRKIYITPFGVDMDLFNPDKRTRGVDGKFVIGTVKTLAPKYGIDDFLRAAAIVRGRRPDIPLEIRIAGTGTYEAQYKQLGTDLGLDPVLHWLGFISQPEAAIAWADMDCAIIFSESESFGVSAVEAQAAGIPVIISDIPGLMEATDPGKTAVVVPRGRPDLLAEEIVKMYDDREVRKRMGCEGRKFVTTHYEVNRCFEQVEEYYREIYHLTRP